ncbi:glycosyl hydrolase [Fibrobacterota bacterium]
MIINQEMQAEELIPKLKTFWDLSAGKILDLDESWDPGAGAPVFTSQGKYVSKGWTEWTQGFQFGSAILQFDAAGEQKFLDRGRERTLKVMGSHVTHMGVHDHGFNNVSTYGNLLRLMREGRIPEDKYEKAFYELALKCSGAVQARRWTVIPAGGFIYSFNGPHSLFADTIRSLRALALSHKLGHVLLEEKDTRVSLLQRLIQHAQTTAEYIVYYGEGRDVYDIRGRVAHEAIFNTNDGSFRCPSSQQGYSPFSTWTRALAWIMLGYAEELEFLDSLSSSELENCKGGNSISELCLKAAVASCDFYLENTPSDGIPYWDTGAPGLSRLGDYLNSPADPFNPHEPVDSSAAAIAAQGLLRLGRYFKKKNIENGEKYWLSGLTLLGNLLQDPYLSTQNGHQGLLLHSVYHRPNGWDHVPSGSGITSGESCMWGDYHLREAALYLQRIIDGKDYYCFFGPG